MTKWIVTLIYEIEKCCGNYSAVDFRHVGIFDSEDQANEFASKFNKEEENSKAIEYIENFIKDLEDANESYNAFLKFLEEDSKDGKEDKYERLEVLLRHTNSISIVYDFPYMIKKYKNPYFLTNNYRDVWVMVKPIEIKCHT